MGLVRFIAGVFYRSRSNSSPSNDPAALGRFGEKRAGQFLRANGYKILRRNFRASRGGEVDLVCREKDTLVFVEVKTRSSIAFGAPSEAVNREKQHLISRGALAWLRMLDNPNIFFRFDIVEIVIESDGPKCNLIRDAFQLSEPWIY